MARLLIGVSGGIAAYKAVELVRLATKAGHAVRVVQTPASLGFVGRATFEGVTGGPVLVDEFEADPSRGAFPGDPSPDHDPISHLELVRNCDAYVVAPASANTLAKLAGGQADNLLTSAALACTAPLILAPAMNGAMWGNPATVANIETLRARGVHIVDPTTGQLASKGEWGTGRLAEPADILAAVERVLAEAPNDEQQAIESHPLAALEVVAGSLLHGLHVLVTAGGTREPIDAVRYVGNRSSGRMGVALAAEAARRGAEVTLVGANLAVAAPDGVRLVEVSTAAELEQATRTAFATADVLLMAAAVADFRPADAADGKIKKGERDDLTVRLEPTTDVLASLAAERRDGQTLIGFAAEHGAGALEHARGKLERKQLDAIVLNDVSQPGIGFDSTDNEVTVVTAGGEQPVPRASKAAVASAILDRVESLRTTEVKR
ncbi:MAG TPA: bifunctional phosphopantothenoylcysteine decarboxylase/phosphopantothenate--cysteine ligase CoaBC [Thermoleophilaceae bacterium]|nr:bifunctional phosphopantothenoylcysteine decarboxylase/phosphopantothenate--cysteine ligase CoaBC [Thermoleophilaceae bacterium]